MIVFAIAAVLWLLFALAIVVWHHRTRWPIFPEAPPSRPTGHARAPRVRIPLAGNRATGDGIQTNTRSSETKPLARWLAVGGSIVKGRR